MPPLDPPLNPSPNFDLVTPERRALGVERGGLVRLTVRGDALPTLPVAGLTVNINGDPTTVWLFVSRLSPDVVGIPWVAVEAIAGGLDV
jgi:hypothetical protein